MSVAYELRVLELQSQVEVLERLRLLTNFGSSLVTVTGCEGAGKTWIAQRYLEAWAEDKNQSLLMCFHNQTDEQRRMTLLSQIDSGAFFDPSLSLLENVSDLLDDEPCNIVMVIDDAQLLSEPLISELWMLIQYANDQANWSIHVILFSLPNVLDSLLTRLTYGQENKPVEVELEPLTKDDADRFFEFYVMRFVKDGMERKVRNAYSKARKIPGEIMALGEKKMEKRIIIRSIVGSPKNIALAAIILLLLIGGGYYAAFYSDDDPSDKPVFTATPEAEQTVIPTVNHEDNASTEMVDDALDDTQALPPTVTDQTANVGIEDDSHKRLIVSSEVVDALIENEHHPAETTHSQTKQPPSSKNTITTAPNQPNIIRMADDISIHDDVSFSLSPDKLMALSERSYTIQLGAFGSLNEAENFVNEHDLLGQINAYSTVREEKQWFIVTYHNYPTIQLARDAIETLPDQMKALGPWAKSLQQVHREIERSK